MRGSGSTRFPKDERRNFYYSSWSFWASNIKTFNFLVHALHMINNIPRELMWKITMLEIQIIYNNLKQKKKIYFLVWDWKLPCIWGKESNGQFSLLPAVPSKNQSFLFQMPYSSALQRTFSKYWTWKQEWANMTTLLVEAEGIFLQLTCK